MIAVAGRSTLPRTQWARAGFEYVHTLGDYTDQNTAIDPELTGQLLTCIGRQIGSATTTLTT